MKCQFCKPPMDVKEWDKKKVEHLIATKDMNDHIHIHGPIEDKPVMKQFLEHIQDEVGITTDNKTSTTSCPYCGRTIGDGDAQLRHHLITTIDNHNHIHVHGPIDDKPVMEEMVDAICAHAEIANPTCQPPTSQEQTEETKIPDKVVFHNRQAIGDILTMTAGVRDFKLAFPSTEVGVTTTAAHIWDHNPNINWDLTREAVEYRTINGKHHPMVYEIGPGYLTNKSNMWDYHMCNSFRMSIEQKMNITIPQTVVRPDLYMTEEEYNRPPLIDGPYWVIVVGGEPGWPVKMYPQDRWQEVVNILKDEIQFVQLGVKGHPWPHLENVIDYIGKTEDKNTGIRDLFNIFLHTQGSLGLVSMHMHLSAAFNNPCVVIAGAREPAWFTNYFGHQYLQTNGCLPCAETGACWKCKFEGCMQVQTRNGMEAQDKIPPCVDIIHPEEVVTAIRKYYDGGRLKYGKKVPNKFFKHNKSKSNVYVPGPPVKIEIQPIDDIELKFGGADVTEKDWMFIENILKDAKISSVLQFGLGITTSLFMKYCDKVTIYETNKNHELIEDYKRVKDIDKLEFRFWDGKEVKEELPEFDLAFVDGPPGGGNREFSTKISAEHAKVLLIHDENRKEEKMWRDKYVKDSFVFKQKGGNRCAIWEKAEGTVIPQVRINLVPAIDEKPTSPAEDSERVWMLDILKDLKADSLLEFGTGETTKTFKSLINKVVSYEADKEWYDIYKKDEAYNGVDLRLWDGVIVNEELEDFDVVFVDGPRAYGDCEETGLGSRKDAIKLAAKHGKYIIVHDATREQEVKHQKEFLSEKFYFIDKFQKCFLWGRKDQKGLDGDKVGYNNYGVSLGTIIPEVVDPVFVNILKKPKVRLISTARGWGGCARSITTIMKFLLDQGHHVEFVPFHSKYVLGKGIGNEFAACLSTTLKDVAVRDYSAITEPTEITFVYFDDYIWEAPRPDLGDIFSKLKTDRKIMMLNYRRGKVGEVLWTRGWDKYMFLNSTQEAELLKVYPGAEGITKVLPPCTILEPFLNTTPNYEGLLKLIRHNSQGDTKFPKQPEWEQEMEAIRKVRKDVKFLFMPGPSFAEHDGDYIIKHKRNNPPVPEFLSLGNCYYYSLPEGYFDMGPRVILEAMASGLSVIADNWGGARDRVTPETGWLCGDFIGGKCKKDVDAFSEIISEMSPGVLKEKGEAARQRAIDNFIPERWIEEILEN